MGWESDEYVNDLSRRWNRLLMIIPQVQAGHSNYQQGTTIIHYRKLLLPLDNHYCSPPSVFTVWAGSVYRGKSRIPSKIMATHLNMTHPWR